jgi:hypothetical protein
LQKFARHFAIKESIMEGKNYKMLCFLFKEETSNHLSLKKFSEYIPAFPFEKKDWLNF